MISGLLVAFDGMRSTLLLAMAVTVTSIVHVARLSIPEPVIVATEPGAADGVDGATPGKVDLRGTLRVIRGVPGLLALIVFSCFNNFIGGTFMALMDCLAPFGMLVNYGNASGHPAPLDLLLLAKNGSLSVCRPALSSVTGNAETMRATAADLFDLIGRGVLKPAIARTYPLRDAAAAHRDIEARKFAGSVLLLP